MSVATVTEEQIQFQVVEYLNKKNILHFHVPNGSKASIGYRIKLKKLGVKSGVPDLCIPIPIEKYHSLWIELKKEKGIVSPTQKEWLAKLNALGHLAVVCYSYESAVSAIDKYLSINSTTM